MASPPLAFAKILQRPEQAVHHTSSDGRHGRLSGGMGQLLAGGSLCQNGLNRFSRSSFRYSRPVCHRHNRPITSNAAMKIFAG